MARKKASPPPPVRKSPQISVMHMKGSAEYVDWLEAAHKKTRLPKVTIFRIAVEAWAKANKLDAPPEI